MIFSSSDNPHERGRGRSNKAVLFEPENLKMEAAATVMTLGC